MNDDIIPCIEGKSLYRFLERQGVRILFFGTGLIPHTRDQVMVTGLFCETGYLPAFLEELFEGDVQQGNRDIGCAR